MTRASRTLAAVAALCCAACAPADLIRIVAEESFAEDQPPVEVATRPEPATPAAPGPESVEAQDPALVARLSSFMVEFCTRVRRANGKYIDQHVALPLTASRRGGGGDAGALEPTTVIYENAWEFKESGICADLTWLGCGLDVVGIEGGWRVRAGHGSAAVELDFEPRGQSFRLVGMRPAS